MSTPRDHEDRLRQILAEHAETVVPAGDGLARIQQRLERSRPWRVLLPVGGLVAAGLAVVLVVQSVGIGARDVVQNPSSPPPTTAQPTPSTSPTTDVPGPSPSPAPATYDGPAIWPFHSQAEGQEWLADRGGKPWAGDPLEVSERFASDFLALSGVTASVPSSFGLPRPHRYTTQLSAGGRSVGRVELARYGDAGPWTVVRVGGTDLTLTTPAPGSRVRSPLQVSGRVTGVDENVRLDLVTRSGAVIATSGAPAGSEVPWEGELRWSVRGWSSAAVVGTTRSMKDGTVTRIVAVPVLPA